MYKGPKDKNDKGRGLNVGGGEDCIGQGRVMGGQEWGQV